MQLMEIENIYNNRINNDEINENNEIDEINEDEIDEINEDDNVEAEEDLFNDEIIKAKIAMILFIYQINGKIANNNFNSIDDLIEDVTNKVYNLLTQELIFIGDYDTAFNVELRDVVKNHVTEYFTE